MINDDGFDLRLIFLPPGYCNYRCRFCHLEGLSTAQGRLRGQDFEPERIREVVEWLRPIGLAGVTISGGEPLLALDNVLDVTAVLPPLPLTLVTNGTRLWSLIDRFDRLNARPLRINLNVPTFESSLFQQLTGQKKFSPSQALESARTLVSLGVEVNLNCVLCPGYNDSPQMLKNFILCADKLGFNSTRFLVQNETSEQVVLQTLKLWFAPSSPWLSRRGGRVLTFIRKGVCSVEVMMCQRETHQKKPIREVGADLYLSARNSIKFGLWDKEIFFADWAELRSLLAGHLGMAFNDSSSRAGTTTEARVY